MEIIKFDVRNLKIIAVYFFFIEDKIVYIGRTNNLTNRLQNHLNKNDAFFEEWKLNITKICYFECQTNTDSDILETYLINEYKPIYNKDKVYLDKSTFSFTIPKFKEINYKKVNLDTEDEFLNNIKLGKSIDFKLICLKYFDALTNNDEVLIKGIEENFEIIKEAYTRLGVKKIKALDYRKKNLEEALINLEKLLDKDIILKKLNLRINQSLPVSELKSKIQEIYNELNINLTAKATDVKQWYEVREYNQRNKNDFTRMIKILKILV